MQAITRNPLAEPGLLGVNAGAAFAVVFAIYLFDIGTLSAYVWFAFVGAAIASVVVFVLGSLGRGGATPIRLALAGAALTALLGSFTSAVLLLDQQALDQYRFWAVGSLAGRDESTMLDVLPFIAVGLVLSIGLARPLNSLGLGEDDRPGARHTRRLDAGHDRRRRHPAVRRGDRRLRADRLRRSRRAARARGRSADPTSAGCCRTRPCSGRSCCSPAMSPAA